MQRELDGALRFWRIWPAVLVVLFSVFGVGLFMVAGFLPPPAPTQTAQQVADLYANHAVRIRVGVTIAFAAYSIWGLLVGAITATMMRTGNRRTRQVLAYTQLASGAVGWIIVLFPLILFLVAAYRPHRDPQLTQTLNDMGWIMLVMSVPPYLMEMISIAIAVFLDHSDKPRIPRWVGYLNLWISLLFFFDMLVPSFKTGISAWNGMLSFYIALVAFGLWIFTMAYWCVKVAIDELRSEQAQLGLSATDPDATATAFAESGLTVPGGAG